MEAAASEKDNSPELDLAQLGSFQHTLLRLGGVSPPCAIDAGADVLNLFAMPAQLLRVSCCPVWAPGYFSDDSKATRAALRLQKAIAEHADDRLLQGERTAAACSPSTAAGPPAPDLPATPGASRSDGPACG